MNEKPTVDELIVEDIKVLIDFDESDDSVFSKNLGKKLSIWVKNASRSICIYCGIDSLPEVLSGVVTEMAQAKFVKLGYEGTTASSEEGLSFTWSSSDLEPFKDVLDGYKKNLPNADDYGGVVTVH
ncbi:hypothetical protein QYM39_06025 [Pediococcus pentosaceus]|uniref:phage head-tail connector protein n=1 Tax=Pediococcus pentosaceus TaxID=1255 RepID=UPI002658CCC6|nr:phage head-tail connector protein [Pediococcus pentosaceus]WKF70465.1 hypothetical protein QYM39_06025 [Pediococcus pentosaceus]